MRSASAQLLGDERAMEGLPIRVTVTVVITVASVLILFGIFGTIGATAETELHASLSPGEISSNGAPSVQVTVIDDNGEHVTDAVVVVTEGTAELPAPVREGTGTDNTATVPLSTAALRDEQNRGTLTIEIIPPPNSRYVDSEDNPTIIVRRM